MREDDAHHDQFSEDKNLSIIIFDAEHHAVCKNVANVYVAMVMPITILIAQVTQYGVLWNQKCSNVNDGQACLYAVV